MWSLLQLFNSGLWCKSSHRPYINKRVQLWSNKILFKKQTVGQIDPWSRSFPKAFSGIRYSFDFIFLKKFHPDSAFAAYGFHPAMALHYHPGDSLHPSNGSHVSYISCTPLSVFYSAFWWSTSSSTFLRKGYLKSCISAHAFFLPSHLADNLTRCWIQGWNSLSCISFSLVVLSGRFLI